MTMDYDGYLWVGTRSGLVRYDGSHFKTYLFNKRNKNEWTSAVLYMMHIPSEKKVIVKTRDGSSYSIGNGILTLFYDTAMANFETPTRGYYPSLALFKKFDLAMPHSDHEENWYSRIDAVLPVNGTDFIVRYPGSAPGTLAYFKNGVRERLINVANSPSNFLLSKGRRFLLDVQNIMYVYDTTTGQFNKTETDWGIFKNRGAKPADVLFYSDPFSDETICYYKSGFYLLSFDPGKNSIKFLPQFNLPGENHIWSGMLYDSINSTFFLRTENEGFFQVKLKKIKTFNTTQMLLQNSILNGVINYSVLKTSDSTVVIPSGFQFTATSSATEIRKIGSIFSQRETIGLLNDKSILCTQNGKLYYYSHRDNYRARHTYNESFNKLDSSGDVMMVFPEGDSVWVSTNNQLHCLTLNTIRLILDRKRDSDKDHCDLRLFYRINKHEAFVANETGLYILKTSYPYKMTRIPEMQGKQVRHISPYKDVLILSVYREGLYVLKKNLFLKVPLGIDDQGLVSCHSTYIDKDNFIWIPTDRGLYKSTAASVVGSALSNGSEVPFFFSYGKADGIDNTEFNGRGVPTYAVLNNGQVFYPSMGGIVTFKPGDLINTIADDTPVIEKVLIDNKETEYSKDSISLAPGFKYLSIDLVVPHFGEPNNLFLEYNFDNKEWKKIPVADKQRITLVEISSGRHQLVIRKRTGFGNMDFTYKTITITRKKSIYEKVWFYIAVAAAVGFLIWLFLHLKIRNISRKKAALQKKVDEQTTELSKEVVVKDLLINIISHDMATPLRHISFVSGVLAKGLEKDPEKAREALTDIQSTSEKLLSGSLTIINWMKYNNKKITVEKRSIHLYSLVNEVLGIYIPVAKSKGVSLINDVPQSKFVEADNTILATIFNNLVSNAIKHITNGEIRISFNKPGIAGRTGLKISDTGSGMSEETLYVIREILKGNLHAVKTTDKINTGLGYVMIAELLKIHDFSLSIESGLNKGTTVSLTIG